jgi:hypothetical protein
MRYEMWDKKNAIAFFLPLLWTCLRHVSGVITTWLSGTRNASAGREGPRERYEGDYKKYTIIS